jgi:hypothetical protein
MFDPHYKALLIGNGTFERDPHKLAPLKGPVNDLRLLAAALTHPEFGMFDASNVKQLLDGTHSDILEAIELFFSEAGPQDHLLFYYSGHGYPDMNNNLYLCARNTRTNLLGSSAISDKTVNLMAENSRARKFIFMLDCCHSGGFKGGTTGVQLAHGSGRCLITACASDQLSADAGEAGGASTFTHYLAEALTSGIVDSDGDGVVLTSELFKYVQPRVYNATKQTVQWTMDKTFGEAAIARAARRDPTRPPIPEVKPRTETGRPVLEVSETRIEFRDVVPGETLPVERIDVFNTGDGTLDWAVDCEESWIGAERKGDTLFVRLNTAEPGLRRGNLFIRDRGRGGSRTVRVLLHVVAPATPRLVVAPNALDFGSQLAGATRTLDVRVSNGGPGQLQWNVHPAPAPLVVERHDWGVSVGLAPEFSGELSEHLRLSSNGGDVEIPVRGTVATRPAAMELPPILKPAGTVENRSVDALLGWWSNDAGSLRVEQRDGGLIYTDYNLFGVKVGRGTLQLQNGSILLQGTNTFSGAYTGQLERQGETLTGTLAIMGQIAPAAFVRQQPWFAPFATS